LTLFKDFSVIIGILLILYAIAVLFFPPTFGSYFYGIRTKLTMRNKMVWASGQRLFGFSFIGIGFVFSMIGILEIDDKIQRFPMVVLLIGLCSLAKYFVNKILVNKFSIE
jgi:uncharacterized membrane protein